MVKRGSMLVAALAVLVWVFAATSVEAGGRKFGHQYGDRSWRHYEGHTMDWWGYSYRPYSRLGRAYRIHPYRYSYHRHSYRAGDKAFWGGLAGGVLGSFLVGILTSPPTWREAREEPEERCDWYYDSEGRSRWQCQGSEWRSRGSGPPVMPLPPPQLPPSSWTSSYSTSSPVPQTPLPVPQEDVSPVRHRSKYPPARIIADCKRTPDHPACQGW